MTPFQRLAEATRLLSRVNELSPEHDLTPLERDIRAFLAAAPSEAPKDEARCFVCLDTGTTFDRNTQEHYDCPRCLGSAPARELDESKLQSAAGAPVGNGERRRGQDVTAGETASSTEALPGERPGGHFRARPAVATAEAPQGTAGTDCTSGAPAASVVPPPERARREVWLVEDGGTPLKVDTHEAGARAVAWSLMSGKAVRYVAADEAERAQDEYMAMGRQLARSREHAAMCRAEASRLHSERASLRAENARLVAERDAAKAEVERLRALHIEACKTESAARLSLVADAATLRAEVERLTKDNDDLYASLGRLADLLHGVANGMKGEPPADTLWSFHDLPQLARDASAKLERYEEALKKADQAQWHGCMTGDCPHNNSHECYRPLTEELRRIAEVVSAALASPASGEKT